MSELLDIEVGGQIDLARFAALPLPLLREWISSRLQGTARGASGERDDMPHFLVTVLYKRLPNSAREDIRTVILSLLYDWRLQGSGVRGNARSELLMLVPLLAGSEFAGEATHLLLGSLAGLDGPDEMARRALQALVGLGYRGTEEFWKVKHRTFGDEVTPVVLSALLSSDVARALLWLNTLEWSVRLGDVVTALLPGVLEKQGSERLVSAFRSVHQQLGGELRRELQLFFEEEGVTLPSSPETADEWEGVLDQWLETGIATFYSAAGPGSDLFELVSKPFSLSMREAIGRVLSRWDPFGRDAGDYSVRLLLLLDSCHSSEAISALVSAVKTLPQVHHGLSEREWQVMVRAVALLGRMSVAIGVRMQSPANELRDEYSRSLFSALQFEWLAIDALGQIATHLDDENVSLGILAALRHEAVDMAACVEVLSAGRAPEAIRMLIQAATIELASRRTPEQTVAVKLVAYWNDEVYDDAALGKAVMLLRDAEVPLSAGAWVNDVLRRQQW